MTKLSIFLSGSRDFLEREGYGFLVKGRKKKKPRRLTGLNQEMSVKSGKKYKRNLLRT